MYMYCVHIFSSSSFFHLLWMCMKKKVHRFIMLGFQSYRSMVSRMSENYRHACAADDDDTHTQTIRIYILNICIYKYILYVLYIYTIHAPSKPYMCTTYVCYTHTAYMYKSVQSNRQHKYVYLNKHNIYVQYTHIYCTPSNQFYPNISPITTTTTTKKAEEEQEQDETHAHTHSSIHSFIYSFTKRALRVKATWCCHTQKK